MYSIKVFLLFFLLKNAYSQVDLEGALRSNGVIPDVIDSAPERVVGVTFPSGARAELGNVLPLDQVQQLPRLSWPTEEEGYYTVVMLDADQPTRQDRSAGETVHWIIGNILGSDILHASVPTEFMPPNPQPGSGLHRYVILVYKQPYAIAFPIFDDRTHFDLRNFAREADLGTLIAVNFYQTQA